VGLLPARRRERLDLAGPRRRGPGPAGPAWATGCTVCPDAGYAVSPDGRAVAYVISADHGDVVELVARNLITGRQNTIIMATKPSPGANNWPPGISSLTWAPDDVHLAVQLYPTGDQLRPGVRRVHRHRPRRRPHRAVSMHDHHQTRM